MVVSNKFVFLHLQKCGGSFIRNFMLDNVKGSVKIDPQHDGYTTMKGQHKNKPVIGVIRNPWDWYVSVYHYHLPSKGSFMEPIIKEGGNFEGFLKLFLTKDKGKIHNMNFDWMGNKDCGPLTYRVIKCFNPKGLKIGSLEDANLDKVDIIKMENLAPNFIDALDRNNIVLSDEAIEILKNKEKVNTSKHDHYRDYYTDELIELVRHKDRLIIEKFEYEF